MHKPLDFEGQFNFAPAVKALAGSTLVRFELGKLGLPKAEDVAFDAANSCHIPDLEIQTVGNR
jgi:hypothetical protein